MTYEFTYRKYAEALYHALIEDAFYIAMERSSSKEAMLRYYDYSMLEAQKYGELVFPESHDYGTSIWSKPIDKAHEEEKQRSKKEFLKTHMGQESLDTYNSIVNFMSEKSSSIVKENFWYLSIIGILPKYQGQGYGVELVEKILEKTDSIEAPTFLETFTQRNISFYKRLGYKIAESFYEPTSNAEYWLMIREFKS